MVLESLLLTCLVTESHFSESGVRVALEKEAKEVVLFFKIDEKSNQNSTFRADLNIKANENICDGLVFLAKDQRKIFCFVEMKGGDIRHAAEQIASTYHHVTSSLTTMTQGKRCYPQYKSIIWKAYIAVNASSPYKITEEIRQKLTNIFGKGNFMILRGGDFGKFIRS
jgi:hypothetical protein